MFFVDVREVPLVVVIREDAKSPREHWAPVPGVRRPTLEGGLAAWIPVSAGLTGPLSWG